MGYTFLSLGLIKYIYKISTDKEERMAAIINLIYVVAVGLLTALGLISGATLGWIVTGSYLAYITLFISLVVIIGYIRGNQTQISL